MMFFIPLTVFFGIAVFEVVKLNDIRESNQSMYQHELKTTNDMLALLIGSNELYEKTVSSYLFKESSDYEIKTAEIKIVKEALAEKIQKTGNERLTQSWSAFQTSIGALRIDKSDASAYQKAFSGLSAAVRAEYASSDKAMQEKYRSLKEASRYAQSAGLALAALAVIAVFVAWFLTVELIRKSLAEINDAFKLFINRKVFAKLKLTSAEEFNYLKKSFNSMASVLDGLFGSVTSETEQLKKSSGLYLKRAAESIELVETLEPVGSQIKELTQKQKRLIDETLLKAESVHSGMKGIEETARNAIKHSGALMAEKIKVSGLIDGVRRTIANMTDRTESSTKLTILLQNNFEEIRKLVQAIDTISRQLFYLLLSAKIESRKFGGVNFLPVIAEFEKLSEHSAAAIASAQSAMDGIEKDLLNVIEIHKGLATFIRGSLTAVESAKETSQVIFVLIEQFLSNIDKLPDKSVEISENINKIECSLATVREMSELTETDSAFAVAVTEEHLESLGRIDKKARDLDMIGEKLAAAVEHLGKR